MRRRPDDRVIGGTQRSEVAMFDLTKSPEWSALTKHFGDVGELHLRQLFADEPDRAARLTAGAGDLVAGLLQASGHRRDAAALDRPGPGRRCRGPP